MKIPDMFIPEHKNLEKKTEQLLEEAKMIKEQDTSAKERLIDTLISYLDTQGRARHVTFYNMLEASLQNESYHNVMLAQKQKGEYWIKKISNLETKVFFKKPADYSQPEYGLAVLKKGNLKLFCEKMEKHINEENRIQGFFFDHYNSLNLAIGGLTAASAITYSIISQVPEDVHTSKYLSRMLAISAVVSFYVGGRFFDSYMHKISKKKMIKLCSYYTEDEKEAIRIMLE